MREIKRVLRVLIIFGATLVVPLMLHHEGVWDAPFWMVYLKAYGLVMVFVVVFVATTSILDWVFKK